VLDEFAGLKRMEAVESAAAQAAGFGVKFFFVLQNLPQLKEIYSDAWETFLGNSGLRLFFQIDDNFTRTYLAQQLGEAEVLRQTRSGSQAETASVSTTEGHSTSTTAGTSSSLSDGDTIGTSKSTTDGQNYGRSSSWSSGTSGGHSFNYKGPFGFIPRGRSSQRGSNQSDSRSRTSGWSRSASDSLSRSRSNSRSFSESESRTGSTSTSRSESQSRSSTDGWGEAVHKRFLLNPDEIGRFLSRIDTREHPGYPGMALALIPGEQALAVRRVNYFQSPWFDAFFDPHPDHPAPPTLAERIARMAELRKPSEPELEPEPEPEPLSPEPPPVQRRFTKFYAAAGIAATIAIAVGASLVLPIRTASKPPPTPLVFTQPVPEPAPPHVAAIPPPAAQPKSIDPREMARRLQAELYRVGCYPGSQDGNWESQSANAVRLFNRQAHAELDSEVPSSESVATVREHAGRVCPLICPQGERADGDHCVALAKAPPRAVSRRPQPTENAQGKRCVTALGTTYCE
jgi:TraM recognition site of TraD and TraG